MTQAIQNETRSVRDMLIAAKVLAKDGKATESPCKTCRVPVWVSFFFDGTGNNKAADAATLNQTNVVALFEAHKQEPEKGIQKFYYEGIGTQFEFDKYSEVDTSKISAAARGLNGKKIDITDPEWRKKGYSETGTGIVNIFRAGFAYGIQQRLQKAIFELIAYLDQIYTQKGITEINLSAFGFSRGAAEARIFMNWLEYAPNVTTQGAGSSKKLFYRGKPIKIKFLGIFDTVESIGNAGQNKNPQSYRTRIEDYIEHSMHLVASLEMRQSFPLTPTGKPTATTVKGLVHDQKVYPGVHSNVGGGYMPMEQARNLGLCRITLHVMYNRACAYGLKFFTLNELSSLKQRKATFTKFYAFDSKWQQDLNNFMAHVKGGTSFEQQMQGQIALYHQWIREGGYARFIHRKTRERIGRKEKITAITKLNDGLFENIRQALNVYVPEGARPYDVVKGTDRKSTLPKEVIYYFENYVCDSVGGFIKQASDYQAILTDMKAPNFLIPRGIAKPT
ncbi:T6SS phospholipase effector Tle1-like catalytic domain-containing protein [Acinetobacter sp. ABJ_C5_2]|uniref:T6SS phospholipase effector Tle1-like catalytic domain-containing protein n=1 Tax=Acinetobacter sp. ABJ_C5_2 TaxID=3376992 RepID=UPI0037C97D19